MADAGDDLMIDEGFGSTSMTFTYDNAGNLVDDGHLVFYYDTWNRLVKAASAADKDGTIHQAAYDGTGRGPLTRHQPRSGVDAKRRRASPAVTSQGRAARATSAGSRRSRLVGVHSRDAGNLSLTRHDERDAPVARRAQY